MTRTRVEPRSQLSSNISAMTAHRNGHGKWLRTIMRGALIDIRRRSNFRRIGAGARDEEGAIVEALRLAKKRVGKRKYKAEICNGNRMARRL